MKVAIFVGPTLPAEQVKEILPDALILPPAEQGDVEYACRMGCQVIGLIDGVHTLRLPVWHKEILGSLKQGIRFLGAASMGALRAVECAPWGAEPVGEVAQWYQSGLIEADDEVCVAHLGSKYGWRQLSLPLVNIRATLKACQAEVQRAQQIIQAAQSIFYSDRTWPKVFEAAGCDKAEQEQILSCELDIKAADALHLCYYIQNLPARPEPARQIKNASTGYGGVFLRNDRKLWTGKKIVRQHELASPAFRDAALNRALALEFCKMVGLQAEAPIIATKTADDLDRAEFKRLRDEEVTLQRARDWLSNSANGFEDVPLTLDMMRITGAYSKAKEVR